MILKNQNMEWVVTEKLFNITCWRWPGSVSLLTLGLSQKIRGWFSASRQINSKKSLILFRGHVQSFLLSRSSRNAGKHSEQLFQIALHSLMKGWECRSLETGRSLYFWTRGKNIIFFAKHGFVPKIYAEYVCFGCNYTTRNIPATFEVLLIKILTCTGTLNMGISPNLPDFVRSRTVVALMALHRVVDLVPILIRWKKWILKSPLQILKEHHAQINVTIRTKLMFVRRQLSPGCVPKPPGFGVL